MRQLSVFYFHRQNKLAKQLSEMTGMHGFIYSVRSELEFKLQGMIADAGYDLYSSFHTVVSSLAGAIDLHIPLDPDNELDRHTLKIVKNRASWSSIRVVNGPKMSTCIGYVSQGAQSPIGMGTTEMAQKGILKTSYVPRPL